MRSYILLAFLLVSGWSFGQGNGFSFSYTGPNQIIVGPDCEAPLEWGHPNTPTASSNIPGGMIVSFNIYSISQGYQIGDLVGGGNTITVFYQAIDNYGNNALFGFSIAFIDIIPPEFDDFTTPDDLTVNCTGNFPIADVEVTDNCDEQDIVITITFTETNNAMPCTGGIITRTWVADDDLGNFATFVQTITVLPDNTPPLITNNLVNGSAPCSTAMAQYTTWLNAQRAAFTATDNGCGLMSKTDNAPNPATITSFCGPVPVTFTATDNCNNTSTVVRTFTITNNVPPVITTPASDASGNCNQSNIQSIFNTWINTHGGAIATDDCSGIIWSTSPPSPSLSDTCSGPIMVLFIAGDGCGNADTTSASFVLTDDTPPVVNTNPSSMVLNCASTTIDSLLLDWLTKHGGATATDLCTPNNELVKGYRLGGNALTLQGVLDAWQDSLASGCTDGVIINGVGINNVKAYLPVQFTFTDACGNEADKTGYFGITDNGRPQFVTLPSDTSFTCAQNEGWQDVFQAWYASAGGATYMDQCSDVSVQASITADSAIQYLTATLDTACMQGVAVQIGFTLTDDCGNLSTNTPVVSFSLQDTIAPVITQPATDLAASCALDGQTQLQNWLDTLGGAEASDGCGALTWIFSWVDTSDIMQSGVPFAGPYPSLAGLDCAGGLEIIFTASDACQNSVSDTAAFSLIDTLPPVITIIEDTVHLSCTDTIPLTEPEVADACNGSITLTSSDTPGIDSCLGQPEVIIRTWTATDECGNSSTATITFLRIDSIPPTFTLPADTVAFCSVDTLSLADIADNCDPAPVSSFTDIIIGPACQQTLIRTWTVTDACGNEATAEQSFDLSDTTPPVIETSPGNFIYTCNEASVNNAYTAWLSNVSITDGCSDVDYFIAEKGSYDLGDTSTWPGTSLPISLVLTCDVEISILGDLVAFDACGNAVVEEISFAVQDTTGPTFINCPEVLSVEPDTTGCVGKVQLTPPAFEEICYPDSVSITLTINGGDPIPFDTITTLDTIMPVGIHTALWTATDCKGNAGTCFTSIEIIDEDAISLTCPPDTLFFASTVDCTYGLWVFPPQTTSGECALGVVELRMEIVGNAEPDSVVFSSSSDSVLVAFGAGLSQVLLIARDSTGDIDTCIYVVELRDTIAPVILCQRDTIVLHPSGLDTADLSLTKLVSSATDNCEVTLVQYFPETVTCESAGQEINVMLIALDEAGNADTCIASLVVEVQPLIPLWERGLCDDTLRLFANIPPGPDANYTFSWTGPNGFVSDQENPVIPGSDTSFNGIYTINVQSENGCATAGSVAIMITSLASPEITISADTACTGQQVVLTTQSYTGIVTYQWNQINPAGDTVVIVTTEPELNFIPGIPGDYGFFAIVTQDTCTTDAGEVVQLHVVAAPIADIAEPSTTLCEYDTLFLSPVSVSDSLTYTWSGPGGFSSNDPTPPGIPVTEINSGDVFYLMVSNQFCNSVGDSVVIQIQLSPATPVILGDTLVCEGGTLTLSTTSDADVYSWINPQDSTIVTTENMLVIDPATDEHEGAWQLFITDNGCRSDTSESVSISIDSAIQIEILAPNVVCEGDSITLQFSPLLTGTYNWTGPGGFSSNDASPALLAVEGTYHLFVETSTGCADSDSIEIAVDELPEILSLETDADSCANGIDAVTLWAITDPESQGQFEFHWQGPSGFMSQDSSPVIPTFNSELNGVYELHIINGTCTTDTVSISIEVTDSPAAPLITGENVYCSGDTIILSIASPVDGAVYTWTFLDFTLDIPDPGVLVLTDIIAELSDTYTVVAEINGCVSAPAMIDVLVRPTLPAPVITSASLVCEGDSLILTSDAPPGAIITWIGPNGFSSDEVNPVIFPVLPVNEGEYFAFYMADGCMSDTSEAKQINIQPTLISPSLLIDINAVCLDDPLPFTVCIDPSSTTSGAQYAWYVNGVPLQQTSDSCIIITGSPLVGGNNQITAITMLNGCSSEISAAVIIQGDEFPSVTADAGLDMQYCPGEIITLDATAPTQGTGQWTSDNPEVIFNQENDPQTTINGLPPGAYTLTWTLSFASCTDYSSDEVEIEIIPSPQILPDTFEVPFGQTITFTATTNDSLSGIPFILTIVSGTTHGNVLHAGNGVFRYTPNIGFVGTDMMVYRICSTDCPEECEEAVVTLLVGNEDDCFTPTLFTPNSDGINDELIIPCLETDLYPDNKMIVFNEWGDAVFVAAPYLNDWEGTSNGESLPVGTYFYIMDFGDGSEPKRSFLVLER